MSPGDESEESGVAQYLAQAVPDLDRGIACADEGLGFGPENFAKMEEFWLQMMRSSLARLLLYDSQDSEKRGPDGVEFR